MNQNYAIIHAVILDGTQNMKPVTGQILFIKEGKIEKIVPEGADLTGYEIIDLCGKYILPGLINLHVHLAGDGKPKKKQQDAVKAVKLVTGTALARSLARKLVAGYAKTELLSGVTTIRTVGGILDFDSRLRDKIQSGKAIGPRILAGNMAVSVPEGHMVNSLAYCAENPSDAVRFVDKISEGNPDLIKLMITGGVLDAKVKGEPGVLKMQPEIIKAACEEAHKLGYQVAAHVESPTGVLAALQNGVDTIEHGAKPDEEMIKLFKEHHASHIATISPALPFAEFDQEISHATDMQKFNGQIVMDGVIECANECLKNGIPVGLGTDTACPYVTHYDMWRELRYFEKYCHVSRAFAIYTATLGNAKIAKIDHETGSIEAGKSADLIVCEKNPLDDLCALRNLSMVIMCGKIFHSPKVKKFEEVEKQLDKYL